MNSQKWPLLEQLPTGPIKDTLAEIQKDLERIDQTRDVLSTLAKIERRVEGVETITIAIDTLSALSCDIEAGVDSVFNHLNQILGEGWQSQAPTAKIQEAPDLPGFHASQSKGRGDKHFA